MTDVNKEEGDGSARSEPSLASALGDMSSAIGGMRLKQHKNALATRHSKNPTKKRSEKSSKELFQEAVCDSPLSSRSQRAGTSVDGRDAAGSSPSKKTNIGSPNGPTDAPDTVEAAFTIDRSLIERAQRMAAAARAMPDPAKIMQDLQAKLGKINNPMSGVPAPFNPTGRTKAKSKVPKSGKNGKNGKKKTKKGPNLMSAEDEQQLLARIKSLCADSPTAAPAKTPSPITTRSTASTKSATTTPVSPHSTKSPHIPTLAIPNAGSPVSVGSYRAPPGEESPHVPIKFTDKGGALDANNNTETNVGRKYLKRNQALNRIKRRKEERERKEREAAEKQQAMLRQQHAEAYRHRLKKQFAIKQRDKQQRLLEEQRIREEKEQRAREKKIEQAKKAREMQELARRRVEQRRIQEYELDRKRHKQETETRVAQRKVHTEISQIAQRRAKARLRNIKQRKQEEEAMQKMRQAQEQEEEARIRAEADAHRKETNANIRRMKRETRERLRRAQEQADRLQSKEAERIQRRLESRKAKMKAHGPGKRKPKVEETKKKKEKNKNKSDLFVVLPSPTNSDSSKASPVAARKIFNKAQNNLDISLDSLEGSQENSQNEFFIPLEAHDNDDVGVIRYKKPKETNTQEISNRQTQSVPVRNLAGGNQPSTRKPRVRKKKVPVWKRVQPIELSPASAYVAKATKGNSYSTAFNAKKKGARKTDADRNTRGVEPSPKRFSGPRQSVSEGAIANTHGKARRYRTLQRPQPHATSAHTDVYDDLQQRLPALNDNRRYDRDPLSQSRSMGMLMRRNEKQNSVAASTRQRANEIMNMESGYSRGSISPHARQYAGGGNSPHSRYRGGSNSPRGRSYAGGRGHPVGMSSVSRQPVGNGGPKFRFKAKVVVRPYS